MCFGGGSQPQDPTNPAPYTLENAHTAVVKTTRPRTQQELAASAKEDAKGTVKNPTAPSVVGGAGTNFAM